MTNVSIISNCNNNCKYCFQKNTYHKKNLILSYEEISDIFKWTSDCPTIGITGGEPTLHPDIIKIASLANSSFKTKILFTNILCESEIIKDTTKYAPELFWLINSTIPEEKQELFEKNIEYLNSNTIYPLSLGITFTNNPEYDDINIKYLINLGKKYPKIEVFRLSIAALDENMNVSLSSFAEPILKFCKLAKEHTPNIIIRMDCFINNCNIPLTQAASLIDEFEVKNMYTTLNCRPVLDVMADKSVKYCFMTPDNFLSTNSYKNFKTSKDCYEFLQKELDDYMKKNWLQCKNKKNCVNSVCDGPCVALIKFLELNKKDS